MISRKILIIMLLWASQLTENHLLASDYVDDINRAANNEAGHQVIYELNVGSFTTEGTFAAAQQKLADLKALGVDIVWLMPIYPRGGPPISSRPILSMAPSPTSGVSWTLPMR